MLHIEYFKNKFAIQIMTRFQINDLQKKRMGGKLLWTIYLKFENRSPFENFRVIWSVTFYGVSKEEIEIL